MEYILLAILVFGFVPFFLHYFDCYKTENPGLSYVDKSLKTQLFILSKNLVILIFSIFVWYCSKHLNEEIFGRFIVPLKLVIALFISIKIMPNNYISSFQFALESGVKGYKRLSPSYGRLYEITFLCIASLIVGLSILGLQIFYLAANSYDAYVNNVISLNENIQKLSILANSNVLSILKSCIYNSLFLISIGLGLTIIFTLINTSLYVSEYNEIRKLNKTKTGILKMNMEILRHRFLSVIGVVLLCLDIITTYIFYFRVKNAICTTNDYNYINNIATKWHIVSTVIMIIISISIAIETIKIIIKLLLCYRHKRKVIQAIKLQEDINNGKCPETYNKYKGYDFTSKLLDYQFNVFRFMYEPKVLKNKPATIKNIKEMAVYANDLNACKICIFMGIPLMSTNNLILAYKCYKEQIKLCGIKN